MSKNWEEWDTSPFAKRAGWWKCDVQPVGVLLIFSFYNIQFRLCVSLAGFTACTVPIAGVGNTPPPPAVSSKQKTVKQRHSDHHMIACCV